MPRERLNGIDIHFEQFGDGPPLLMLHGFTGSISAWQGVEQRLADQYRVIAVDLIGHGETSSPDDPERYRIERAVEDLCTLLDRLDVGRATVLGYSMGGRVALHLALAAPDRVTTLILESAAPGIADPKERAARVASDERLAQMIERDGIEAFINHWESIPLFASQQNLPEPIRARQRELRLSQSPVGLANSLRGMGAGSMEPVEFNLVGEHAPVLPPVLYIAGEYDEKYCEIGKTMVRQMTGARYVEVPGAGHTIHLEQPEKYAGVVKAFSVDVSGPIGSCHPERT